MLVPAAGDSVGTRSDSRQLRQLQLFRHEMQHFVNVLHEYIANEVVMVSWHEFETDLGRHLAGLDDLHQRHIDYLRKCRFRFEWIPCSLNRISEAGFVSNHLTHCTLICRWSTTEMELNILLLDQFWHYLTCLVCFNTYNFFIVCLLECMTLGR